MMTVVTTMATGVEQVIDQYIAAWNETDPAALRGAVDAVVIEDACYADPLVDVHGRAAIDATIAAAQAQSPGVVFRLAGPVDAHHGIARFTWHLAPAG